MATPLDALFFREVFGRTMRGTGGMAQAFTVSPIRESTDDREAAQIVNSVRMHLTELLDHAEINYISSEITQRLLGMEAALPPEKLIHFEPGDFPTRLGILYFDGLVPIPTILARSGTQPLRALLWGQLAENRGEVPPKEHSFVVPGSYSEDYPTNVVGKIVYSLVDSIKQGQWKDRRFERDTGYQARHAGPWNLRHWIPITYHERFGGPGTVADISDQIDHDWGSTLMSAEERAQDALDAAASVSKIIRLLYVWTQFAQTEIYSSSHYDSSAHDRVVLREGRPPAQVRIISLRRVVGVPQGGTVETNWQYRWKVREHYRNQRVGPGRAFVRRTLVREHIKGPEGKPLAEQDTVQAFVR
jgi:hypothetical protein